MSEPAYRFGLVVEAAADARTVRTLVDRCLVERIEWLEPTILDTQRGWQGIEPQMPFTEWTRAAQLARDHRIQALGNFDGVPGKPYARRAFKTLRLFAKLGVPDVIVLVVDADDQPQRLDGLSQARKQSSLADQVVIGVAIPKREAWILAGFAPLDDNERGQLAAERQRLGFDPAARPHELRHGGGKREAKRAYANLIGSGGADREQACLERIDLDGINQTDDGIGLAAFIREVDQRVVSAVAGRART